MLIRVFYKALLITAAFLVFLALPGVSFAQGHSDEAFARVKEVQERHTDRLLVVKGVEGTAIGLDPNDQLVIKVFAAGPEVAGIPKKLDGVPTDVVITGKFYAFSEPDSLPVKNDKPHREKVDPTARFDRPVPIGVSTGNVGECSSGTIACRVIDGQGNVYALSNNHVYALENDAAPGSRVSQPGLYDTGCAYNADNVIGTLADFEPIDFAGGTNKIDAAIALSSDSNVGNGTPSDGYGIPKSYTVAAHVNQQVQKYGRTTSLTRGKVTGINATIWITYSSGEAYFADQIIVQSNKPFLKAGDSGSLVVSYPDKEAVGLLFAGNASGNYAVANRIDLVLDRFEVDIDGD